MLAAFALLPARRAVLVGFVAGWLFIPTTQYTIHGFPDYTKLSAVCGGVFLCAAIFDFRSFIRLRLAWFDVPILVFCLSPFASSISNELGLHDGISVVFAQVLTWALPYCLGRLYFAGLSSLRELAAGIFAGALAYTPLVLIEFWCGPFLNRSVFGFAQPTLDKISRFGGLRPIVFLESSIMLAVWMAAAALIGIWLWRTRAQGSIFGLPLKWVLPVVILGSLLMRSVNGWFILALGSLLLFATAMLRTRIAMMAVIALMLAFLSIRAWGGWSGRQAVAAVGAMINPVRAESLAFRFRNEQIIGDNARRHPLLGWGRQGRPFYNMRTRLPAIADSLWIAVFAQYGLIGLFGFAALMLTPVTLFLWRYQPGAWTQADVAPAAAMAVVLILYTVDLLFNGFFNPIFMLAAGGLAGLPRASKSSNTRDIVKVRHSQ